MTEFYNAVHCNWCNTTIVSDYGHDFVWCRCSDPETRVAVDGGQNYPRRVFGKSANFTELDIPIEPTPVLEHTNIRLAGAHSKLKCEGRACTLHNRSNHGKRSWVQHWDSKRGMRRISPTTGRSYRDPDEIVVF